jgi:precorrin-6B methylase 2
MIVIIADIVSILFLVTVLLWFIVPRLYGRPSIPTRPERIRKALQLANLQRGQVLYDLGAGDGQALLIAAREFGARAVGIEAGPLHYAWIWLRAARSGVGDQIQLRWANVFKTNLREADVVFVHATAQEILKLAPQLEQQLKPGARLISISADFSEWEPSAFDDRGLIFVYTMPPTSGNLTTYMLKKAK